jgi:hypothetical protein
MFGILMQYYLTKMSYHKHKILKPNTPPKKKKINNITKTIKPQKNHWVGFFLYKPRFFQSR